MSAAVGSYFVNSLVANTPSNGFLVKIDLHGDIIFSQLYGEAGNDVALYLTTDYMGNFYMAGITNGTIYGNSVVGREDTFILHIDANGTLLGASTDGNSDFQEPRASTF